MKRLQLKAAAKINLSLDVTGKRPDGYHTLESIFQSVTVYDTIDLTVEDGEGISLTCDVPDVPCDERNLAWKAAQALLDTCGTSAKITIALHKMIPSGAGMGGGSADAAGVLWGLNRLLKCGYPNEQLREIGVKLGADVPFLLLGGTALAKGIGEELTVLKPIPSLRLIIVKGEEGVSTPSAYRAIDALTDPPHPDTAGMLKAIETGDAARLKQCCGNLFETAIDCADVIRARKRLLDCGAECAVMTGSGAAVFGIFPEQMTETEYAAALRTLQSEFVFAQSCVPADQPFVITLGESE
ncbi:MAG: 4-(cytidine 5'-diphospho)-2-C-methyl-D-erythritol kinase [Oscillospiraceae bacterium]|nr:4-(cytidine 5'-diphospho)-2-C-methyl-D-erythritol kinase [Oscillospiraceae bacterium]